MAAERKKSWPFDWLLLGNFGGNTCYALYGYWHCFLIAWYLGILAEARVAPDTHQSPHSTLCLFTHRNEHMKSIDWVVSSVWVGGGACLGESPINWLTQSSQALHCAALGSSKSLHGWMRLNLISLMPQACLNTWWITQDAQTLDFYLI